MANKQPTNLVSKKNKWEVIASVIANEAFGYNGSDKTNPPMTGLKWAGATLKETIEYQVQKTLDKASKVYQADMIKQHEKMQDLLDSAYRDGKGDGYQLGQEENK